MKLILKYIYPYFRRYVDSILHSSVILIVSIFGFTFINLLKDKEYSIIIWIYL